MLHSNMTRDEGALVLLQAKLSQIARRFEVEESKREKMMLVAAELVSNNIKHAGGRGQIQVWQHPGPVLDLFSLDYGPGIVDVFQAQQDGFSTANTFGKGLGAIRRLSDESYVYTQPGQGQRRAKWSGTVLLARFDISRCKERVLEPHIGIYSRALADSKHNGDRIYLQRYPDGMRWLHLDGVGHGEHAEFSTANLARFVAENTQPLQQLEQIELQLAKTRGAVAMACDLRCSDGELQMTGVGDMYAQLYHPAGLMDRVGFPPGILGRERRSLQLQHYSLPSKSVMITASDGIRRNWDNADFPGLFESHPQLVAYTLGNIMGRVSDDQSIFITSIR